MFTLCKSFDLKHSSWSMTQGSRDQGPYLFCTFFYMKFLHQKICYLDAIGKTGKHFGDIRMVQTCMYCQFIINT